MNGDEHTGTFGGTADSLPSAAEIGFGRSDEWSGSSLFDDPPADEHTGSAAISSLTPSSATTFAPRPEVPARPVPVPKAWPAPPRKQVLAPRPTVVDGAADHQDPRPPATKPPADGREAAAWPTLERGQGVEAAPAPAPAPAPRSVATRFDLGPVDWRFMQALQTALYGALALFFANAPTYLFSQPGTSNSIVPLLFSWVVGMVALAAVALQLRPALAAFDPAVVEIDGGGIRISQLRSEVTIPWSDVESAHVSDRQIRLRGADRPTAFLVIKLAPGKTLGQYPKAWEIRAILKSRTYELPMAVELVDDVRKTLVHFGPSLPPSGFHRAG